MSSQNNATEAGTDDKNVKISVADGVPDSGDGVMASQQSSSKLVKFLDDRFEISKRGSSISNEIKAGFIAWVTMSYIILVNPSILQNATGGEMAPLMSATAFTCAFGSFLIGAWANMPFGMMPGMGLNAYVAFGITLGMEIKFTQALTCVCVSGTLLLIAAQAGVCQFLVKTLLSKHLKNGIVVALGMFQAMIGFQIMGLVVDSPVTLVTLGDMSFSNTKLYISASGLCLVAVLSCQQVKGALLIAILQISVCCWIADVAPPPEEFFSKPSFDLAFKLDFSLWKPDSGKFSGMLLGTIMIFFIQLFDLSGVQYGLSCLAGLVVDGQVPTAKQIFSSAALSSILGSLLGTTPVVVSNESSGGIMEGAKTGLAGITISLLFALSAFISPLLASLPQVATAAPIVLIGAFMMGPVAGINWDKLHEALPSFICFTVVPYTYQIQAGIVAGMFMDCVLTSSKMLRERLCDGGLCQCMSGSPKDSPDMEGDFGTKKSTFSKRSTKGSSSGARKSRMTTKIFSPHVAAQMVNVTEADPDEKDEKAERFLDMFRSLIEGAGDQKEDRDEMLIQALEDYVDLAPEGTQNKGPAIWEAAKTWAGLAKSK